MSSAETLIGRCLKGQYRLDHILGEGGMGVVYKGTQLNQEPQRAVAIKTLRPELFSSAKVRERFQREATLASRLKHTGVASVIDFGLDEALPFLVMELVEGVDLSEVIRTEAPLPAKRALAILQRLTEVLIEAHRHNLVHRDIKPSNIRFLGAPAASGITGITIKVLDFGIAKEIGASQDQLTTTGAMLGTPMYLAPEQAVGANKQVDCRADQYAAGVVLYELLAGHPPFVGSTMASVLFAHIMRPPPPLPTEVPEPLRRVVMRMLKKQPAERFPDPQSLAIALADCAKACELAPAAPRREAPSDEDSAALLRSHATNRSLKVGLAGLIVFSFGLGITSLVLLGLRPAKPPALRSQPVVSPPPAELLHAPAGPLHAGSAMEASAPATPTAARPLATSTPATPDMSTRDPLPPAPREQRRPAPHPIPNGARPGGVSRPTPNPFVVPVAR